MPVDTGRKNEVIGGIGSGPSQAPGIEQNQKRPLPRIQYI